MERTRNMIDECDHEYDFQSPQYLDNGDCVFICIKENCGYKFILMPEEYSGYDYIHDLKITYYNQ